MPQSTPERRKRWGLDPANAETFLKDQGYRLARGWVWIIPEGQKLPTDDERDAIQYLIEEWDFGGWRSTDEADEP